MFQIKDTIIFFKINGLQMEMSVLKELWENVTWDSLGPCKCQECKCVC